MTRGEGGARRRSIFAPIITNTPASPSSEKREMKVSISRIVASVVALAALAGVAASPQLLGPKVQEALSNLAGADPRLLGIAAAALVCSFFASVSAWRTALNACGAQITLPQAAARIGIGSLVNALAPAK